MVSPLSPTQALRTRARDSANVVKPKIVPTVSTSANGKLTVVSTGMETL